MHNIAYAYKYIDLWIPARPGHTMARSLSLERSRGPTSDLRVTKYSGPMTEVVLTPRATVGCICPRVTNI